MGEAKETQRKYFEMDIHDYGKIFPNGTIVTHVLGGRGKVKTLENDWSTDPPTVTALVEVLDTAFPNNRNIPVTDLTPMIELSKEILENWRRKALEFKGDIENMKEAEPILELIDRLLLTIQELQGRRE